MFEKASRLKLRFKTRKGILSTEDLWDLSLAELNEVAKNLNKELKTAEEEDFLNAKSVEDEKVKLAFDVVLHVLNTKKAEAAERAEAANKKAEKQKILGILAKKQDASLENLSEDELKKKLEALE